MDKNETKIKGGRDVFKAFLVSMATYAGEYEFPKIRPCYEKPERIIRFSKSLSCGDYDQWIHFYEDDYQFERVWNNPRKYLELFKRYKGVILPDFSLYRDMPLVMQLWNIYRSRAIGHWLQVNGVNVIPNVRFGDSRTYEVCCDGIRKYSIIAVGAHGNIKRRKDRTIFLEGLDSIIRKLQPTVIIIFGSTPKKYFQKYNDAGIRIISFESDCSTSHKEVK